MQATCQTCNQGYTAIPFQAVADWAKKHAMGNKHVVKISKEITMKLTVKNAVLAPHTDSGVEFIDISKKNVRMHSEKEYTVDASDLELRAGNWPSLICLMIGNHGVRFYKGKAIMTGYGEDQEIGGYEYHSNDGVKLTVWND
jgi:hypothetical protein